MSRRAYVITQLVAWSLYAVVTGAMLSPWARPLLSIEGGLSGAVFGALLSHGIRAWWRRQRWLSLSLLPLAPRIVGSSLVASALMQTGQMLLMLFVFHAYGTEQVSAVAWLLYVVQGSAIFVVWQVLYVAVHAVQRSRQAELESVRAIAALREAELRALRTQLNPHFLFNALNSVRALISDEPTRAQEAVTRLSALLRYTLTASEHARVSLATELDAVNDYLALERLRFEERLQVSLEVPAECLTLEVPVMVLLTLVENAVKHGIARNAKGGTVRLEAKRSGEQLEVTVTNPAPQTPPKAESTQLGLANTRERLKLSYGNAATFVLEIQPAQVTAQLRFPCR